MRTIAIVLIVLFTSTTRAEKPSFYGVAYEEATVTFKGQMDWLSTTTSVGIGMLNAIRGRFGWYTGLELTLPTTTTAPAPRVVTGPNIELVKNSLFLSVVVLYQLTPPQGETPTTHTLGGGVNLITSVTENIYIGLVLSPTVMFGDGNITPSFTLAPNASFKFY